MMYENDRDLMIHFYGFVAKEEMACDEAELGPEKFAEKMQSQHQLQEQQLEMLKHMRKLQSEDQSFILKSCTSKCKKRISTTGHHYVIRTNSGSYQREIMSIFPSKDQKAHEASLKVLGLSSFTPLPVAREPALEIYTAKAKIYDIVDIPVRIAMVGKYTGLSDAYLSIVKALLHATIACRKKLLVDWIAAHDLEDEMRTEEGMLFWGNKRPKDQHVSQTLGSGSRDIAYKLSRRKGEDTFKLLHMILFGRRGKAGEIKNNISPFSGCVWRDNEEKQKMKVKEKLDKCVRNCWKYVMFLTFQLPRLLLKWCLCHSSVSVTMQLVF